MSPDLAWRKSAACLGMAPLFDYAMDDWSLLGPEDRKAQKSRHARAKDVCRGCPVQQECRADTLIGRDEGVRFGIVLRPLDRNKVAS